MLCISNLTKENREFEFENPMEHQHPNLAHLLLKKVEEQPVMIHRSATSAPFKLAK